MLDYIIFFKTIFFDSRAHRKLVALQSKRQHESTDADVAAAAAVETRVHEVLEQKLLSSIRPRSVCTRKTVMN